jgi:hypothetical protein
MEGHQGECKSPLRSRGRFGGKRYLTRSRDANVPNNEVAIPAPLGMACIQLLGDGEASRSLAETSR